SGGAGGGISSITVSGAPRDDGGVAVAATNINALGFRLVRYARPGTTLLRPNQEWTLSREARHPRRSGLTGGSALMRSIPSLRVASCAAWRSTASTSMV